MYFSYVVFSTPDADVFDIVVDILQWIRGKNVFMEEDCMIVNFGFVSVFLGDGVGHRLSVSEIHPTQNHNSLHTALFSKFL